jgi:hypothetical protein
MENLLENIRGPDGSRQLISRARVISYPGEDKERRRLRTFDVHCVSPSLRGRSGGGAGFDLADAETNKIADITPVMKRTICVVPTALTFPQLMLPRHRSGVASSAGDGSRWPVSAPRVRRPATIERTKLAHERYIHASDAPARGRITSFRNVTVRAMNPVESVISCRVRSAAKSKAFMASASTSAKRPQGAERIPTFSDLLDLRG